MKTYPTTILPVFPTASARVLPLGFLLLFTVTAMAQDGWVWQNPRPTGNEVRTLQFVDEMTGMAIGDFGTVLRTTDGGLTWQMHMADVMSEFHDPTGLDLLDAESGVVYGDQAVFLTRDGGLTWKDISNPTSSPRMHDCSFSSRTTVTCIGDGFVHRTIDGGESWESLYVPGAVYLSGVTFVTDDLGWVVGNQGTIFHTTDGGQNWVPQSSGRSADLFDIEFTDDRVGVVLGYSAFLYTSDAGSTWSSRVVPVPWLHYGVNDMDWAGSSLVVLAAGMIYLSDDGGKTWRVVSDDSFYDGRVAILNATTMVAMDSWGGIWRTSNGGATWVPTLPIESFTDAWLMDVWFADRYTGIVVGRNGTILRTTDAGQRWEKQSSGTESWLNAVAFRDPDVGVAVGEETVLRTTDGGITWTGVAVPIYIQGDHWDLQDVAFVDAGVVVAVGYGGILRSEDGGVSWSEQYRTPAGGILFTVSFSGPDTGWVAGCHPVPFGHCEGLDIVLQTADGGRTWTSSEEELPWDLELPWDFKRYSFVDFVDGDTGFALEGHPFWTKIHRTDDGGETWQLQKAVSGNLFGLHAMDREVVTVVGHGGKILRTETGGVATNREADPLVPEVPAAVSLGQNYPNPFNPDYVGTTISYTLPRLSEATLTVYDMLGREVSVLASGTQPAGSYEVPFDATGLRSGVYLYRLQAGEYAMAKRMMVVK